MDRNPKRTTTCTPSTPTSSIPRPANRGGIQFAGYNGAPHSLIANVYTGILPRVGFNYHAFRNTVIRGGYGIYELPSIGFGTTGLSSTSTVNATFQSADNLTPAYELNQGVPHYSPAVDANGLPLIPTSLTIQVTVRSSGSLPQSCLICRNGSLAFNRTSAITGSAEIDYEGNHGVHLPIVLPINQIAPSGNCCFGVKNAQSLRPYPQFLTVSYLTNGGAQSYAALFATLSHRWSNGISVRGAYTWARTLDDVDGPSRADSVPGAELLQPPCAVGYGDDQHPATFLALGGLRSSCRLGRQIPPAHADRFSGHRTLEGQHCCPVPGGVPLQRLGWR